jgi:TonB-linked SusC/RagA family outer membrane protein
MRERAMRFLMSLALGVGLTPYLGAQTTGDARITGRVTDQTGAPLSGANVVVRELGVGAATTENGTYTLIIPASRMTTRAVTLLARSIGYIPVTRPLTLTAGPSTQDFQLVRDPLRLEAVVTTGLATETATNRLGFAVGRVDEVQLREVPASDPIQALTGKIAGARVVSGSGMPGSETSLRLRSATSLSPGASNAPLVIVDGIITKSGLSDINSEDIESIEVLKGPASAGIYGSDAAAGVVNVTTKRGRNAAEGTSVVTARNEYGQSGIARRLPLNESTNCKSRVTLADGTTDFPRNSATDRRVNCTDRSIFYDQEYPTAAPFRDQQDQILGNGDFFLNYVSIARRQSNTNYLVSFENLHNSGIIDVPGVDLNGLNRRNIRLNVDAYVRDNLDMSVGGFYSTAKNQTLSQGAGSPFFGVLFMPPDVNLFADNKNGEPFQVDVAREGATPSSDGNPLYTMFTTHQDDNRTRAQGSFRGRYRPNDWFTVDANYGYDRASDDFREYRPKNYLNVSVVPQGGNLTLSNFAVTAQNLSLVGAASRRFEQLGGVDAIVRGAYLFEDETRDVQFNYGTNFGAAGVPTLDNLASEGRITQSGSETLRARNYFGQAVFDIGNRFNLDGLIRRDGSSLFGSDARWRTFYRATGSYLLSEDFQFSNVDEIRLRISRGTAGLRPPFEAQYETFAIAGGLPVPGVLGNKNLKPAYATETEAGFNLGFFKRVSLEYTYSKKVTTDQIMPVPLSSVNGFEKQWQNAGEITGKTHEMAVGLLLVDKPGTTWNLNLTADRTRQTVSRLNAPSFRMGAGCGASFGRQCNDGAAQSSDVFVIREGEALGAMFGTHWVRTCDELKVNPANASVNCADYVVNPEGLLVLASTRGTDNERAIKFADAKGNTTVKIGDANPNFSAGVSSLLSFRNVSVYGVLDVVSGGNIYNLPRQWLARQEFRYADLDQRGKPDSEKIAASYYANINDANSFSDYFVESGSYSKLRELAVGYTLSSSNLSALHLNRLTQSVKFSLIGRNLITWTKYTGLDPEVSAVGSVAGSGAVKSSTDPTSFRTGGVGDPTLFRLDAFGYPNFRTFSMMIEIGM